MKNFLKENWLKILIAALIAGLLSAPVFAVGEIGAVIAGLVIFLFVFAIAFIVAGMQFPEP